MRPFTSYLTALPVLAFAVATGFLHWHLAVTVAAACVVGAALAIPRRAIVLAAILCSPLGLLAVVVSTATWHWPLFGINGLEFGDAALSFPIGFVLGGAGACSLIPYAAARWSRSGLLLALLAWAGGLLVTAYAASLAFSFLTKPSGIPSLNPDRAATLRGMNYAMWLSFSGLTERPAYFNYEGRIDLAECLPLPRYSFKFSIGVQERQRIEGFTHQPLPVGLRKWFSVSDDGDPRFPCSVAITETSDRITQVSSTCAPTQRMQNFIHDHPQSSQSFDVNLPTVHFQAPWLIPGKDGLLTISAPRGCIADTFPAAESITNDKALERFKLPVGFPRSSFSLMDASRLTQEPWIIHVDLLKPVLQGAMIGSLLHGLNNQIGMAILFLITAVAFRIVVRATCRLLFGTGPLAASTAQIYARLNATWRLVGDWYNSRSRAFRWSLIAALCLIGAFLLLPEFVLVAFMSLPALVAAAFLVLLDPSYKIAIILFLIALCLIEIIAFIIRRFAPVRESP